MRTKQAGGVAYHPSMLSSGRSFDPTKRQPAPAGPAVDYRLARRSVLTAVRRGLLNTTDVCDAHPELLRAGKNIGDPLESPCPICSHESLRLVRYVFGDELGRDSGKVVYPEDWLKELAASRDQFTCYVVEVCVDCAWNHLVHSYMAGKLYSSGSSRRRERG